MKHTIKTLLIAFAAIALAAGCQKESDRMLGDLAGDWHYAAEESGVTEDVWISFTEDGTFEMFQKVGEGPYWRSEGEFTYDADSKVLSGVYSDRYPWKYTYAVSITGSTLEMRAVENDAHAVVYSRETIPASVREKSLPLTKAESVERHM